MNLRITHKDQPSASKGWAQYRLLDVETQKPVIISNTGNEWLSFGNGSKLVKPRTSKVAAGQRLKLDLRVMLNEGQTAGRKRQTVYAASAPLTAIEGATTEIVFRPGSQGAALSIFGATSELPAEYGRVYLKAEERIARKERDQ